jgi:hypothetical protein
MRTAFGDQLIKMHLEPPSSYLPELFHYRCPVPVSEQLSINFCDLI